MSMEQLELLKNGVLKCMETKFIKFLTILLIFSFQLNAQDTLQYNKVIDFNIDSDKQAKRSLNTKNPLIGVSLNLTKILDKSNELINISKLPKGNEEIENELILKRGEYIEIINIDRRKLLSDGSIQIQFENLPDLYNYAELNDLELIRDLSDIQMGVFKIKNIYELESRINLIKDNENIISIELNTLDPTIKPR